jgi:predicted O-methyltransferase YrrM
MIQTAKRFMGKIAHSSLVQEILKFKEINDLDKLSHSDYSVNHLRYLSGTELGQIFADPRNHEEWVKVAERIKELELPEMMGGVNKGDQQAIFYLINHFKPNNVLEIGTHIGCSTAHIALALKQNPAAHLTTVDIIDVNDSAKKHWVHYNSKHSPLELMAMIGTESKVSFVADDSIKFLKNCKQKFDFIFLDGSHKAKMVFQEVPLALRLLNENGIILLHDYFPGNKPLWDNVPAIPGPYLAINKITGEEDNIAAIPLGELPWRAKLNSNRTSLAVLTRKYR